ncbi:testin [Takifugu rubripes]|uniref:testin n=1 Tax=Takifugu rubripes TaxID=31033 RepID=UPI00016EA384|nr:testin [Takifugu rubripes]AAR16278.1 testis derived transcript [Takifugu rubripes]|eukprot:NP_001232024.1 testin [Takifugu rubripes]
MEIEKEVKKMTLGHEFGAGAACLKCKDKCEGFELHFWRKICRNCKCGLTEHNVQMNTEENKKVGKLFEDTKYTGLIAKLKKDGIPSYKGNMITITLPSPATAHVIPPSASSTLVPPAGPAGVVQPAAAPSAGAAPGAAPNNTAPQAVSAAATPVRGNLVPVHISTASANVAPVPKDAPMKSVTYEWAPPVANKHLAVRYIELLPPEKRPVAGTQGAAYRRQQMARQLPEHDQDPSKCHELSPAEVKKMQQFVRKYKDEALGVGDVLLPEDMAVVQAGGKPGTGEVGGAPGVGGAGSGPGGPAGAGGRGAGSGFRPGSAADAGALSFGNGPSGVVTGSGGTGPSLVPSEEFGPPGGATGTTSTAGAMGALGQPQQSFSCQHCGQPMRLGEPAVYAERAGYDKLWHPACFVCCTCKELLVDMIYFWKKGKLYCGRHYGDSEKPRCAGCDEARPASILLIFCNEYTQAEGHNWHLKHFCCFDCDCILAGETYVMENDKPVCTPCYMKSYAVKCSSCKKPVDPEAQRVSYGDHHWHAEPQCFQCSGCSKCLIGQRFMAAQGFLFCSVECKKKIMP